MVLAFVVLTKALQTTTLHCRLCRHCRYAMLRLRILVLMSILTPFGCRHIFDKGSCRFCSNQRKRTNANGPVSQQQQRPPNSHTKPKFSFLSPGFTCLAQPGAAWSADVGSHGLSAWPLGIQPMRWWIREGGGCLHQPDELVAVLRGCPLAHADNSYNRVY